MLYNRLLALQNLHYIHSAGKAQGTINPRLIISLQEYEPTLYALQVKHPVACPPSLHSIGNHSLKAIKYTSITTEINNTHPV